MNNTQYGLIEIGNRAVRLLVAEISSSAGINVITTGSEQTWLGEGIRVGGDILREKIEKTSEVINKYLQQCAELEVSKTKLFGTEVLRTMDGESQQRLLDRFPDLTIFSASDEAHMSLIAAVKGLPSIIERDDDVMAIDAGGGSIECAYGQLRDGRLGLVGFKSYPLGTRVLSGVLRDEKGNVGELSQFVERTVDRYGIINLNMTRIPKFIVLGSAGTKIGWYFIRGTKQIHKESYSPRLVHGVRIDSKLITKFVQYAIRNPSVLAVAATPEDPEYGEVQTALGGLIALSNLLNRYGANEFTISAWGLRYGVALHMGMIDGFIKI